MPSVELIIGETLPDVCIRCGRAAETQVQRRYRWSCRPKVSRSVDTAVKVGLAAADFVAAGAGLAGKAAIHLATLQERSAAFALPVCRRHSWHWVWHRAMLFGPWALGGLFIVALSMGLKYSRQSQDAVFGSLVVLILWPLFFLPVSILLFGPIRQTANGSESGIVIRGVSRRFAQTLATQRGARAEPAVAKSPSAAG